MSCDMGYIKVVVCINFILRHVYVVGWLLLKDLLSYQHCTIMEQKLDELMAEIHQSKRDVDERLAELKREVATTQENWILPKR